MKKVLSNVMKGTFLLLFLCSIVGCTKKDLYNPDTNPDPGKQPLPDPNEYFDFNMREDVNLYVDYDAPGFKTLIEVYDENPLVSDNSGREKKEGVEALFKIYTDDNGRYEGKMNIPTSIKTVYVYTAAWGLPRCVQLEVKDGAVNLDLSHRTPRSNRGITTRTYTFTGNAPYTINTNQNLYSLCQWGPMGDIRYNRYSETINLEYVQTVEQVGSEKMKKFVTRMQSYFNPKGELNVDNSRLVRESKTTNITIKENSTTLDVVFVNRDASYNNTFGYYYYKTSDGFNENAKKYIIFPNVALAPSNMAEYGFSILKCGDKVSLVYYNEQGEASKEFPAGYTVGWFMYADGYNYNESAMSIPNEDEINTSKSLLTSNADTQSFVTVKDVTTGKVIIGVEDGANKSYCDLLFYVDATPQTSIEDPNRPTTDPDDSKEDPEKPDANENKLGTLAFEDIWPTGGDYDMNDVVIEYERKVSFNTSNMVTKIEDTFKPVHNGATYTNAFAYQIDKNQFGTVNNLPNGTVVEKETSSIIVFTNNKTEIGKAYTIAREFDGKSLRKESINEYNPYIIVNYAEGEKDRKEVHLPKQKATDWVDKSLIGDKDDAYYLKRDGSYPFAIDIPIWGFKVVTESKHIDDEYPKFKSWAKSFGKSDTDWYE